ncbi:MAG TPA: GNAT family N-acetyltransferase [Vibrio sp.]|uniref:GNAT family N-acetyltransferase n=1 Tax=Vibrio TaxID=662 RepID=UPI000ECAA2B8|nr:MULTISPECIES: GNAT family N-acetyltransferase [Vibrio]HCH01374.1 GNAT family N-acetyltransferase [Vibrio sp.]
MKTKVLIDLTPHMDDLVALLKDCVASGASVGFLPPVESQTAHKYWQEVATTLTAKPSTRLLIAAFEGEQLVGCVQLSLASKSNAKHRAEVEKLMVHTQHRGNGISKALLSHLEEEALVAGRRLLILDTRVGDIASELYKRMNYTEAGYIPDFALSATGELDGTTFFYKMLS